MYQNLPPKKMMKIARHIMCKVPLCNVNECQCNKCDNNLKPWLVPEQKYLETNDKYWSEFLKAQQTSSANYVYHMQIYGGNQDPTTEERKGPFPPELIHQRVLHMPTVGTLEKMDIFYILNFLLNLLQLKPEKQQEYMEMFQTQGLMSHEILNYMQIIARHPRTGIPQHILKNFLELIQNLINRTSTICNTSFFNPDRIFMKSMVEMDPYELAYLKTIMEVDGKLNKYQFTYLVNFVERLQELPLTRRDEYLKALYDRSILPSVCFADLIHCIRKKSKKFNRQKLIILLNNLMAVMGIDASFEQPIEETKIMKCATDVSIDALKVKKALRDLMKGGIPNIIRLMDLKSFLQDIINLNAEELEKFLIEMKNTFIITMDEFKFIQSFMTKESLRLNKEQKDLLLKTLQKVGSTPPTTAPSAIVALPSTKGPTKAPGTDIESKSKQTTKVRAEGGKDAAPSDITEKEESKEGPEKERSNRKDKKTKTKEKKKSKRKSKGKK